MLPDITRREEGKGKDIHSLFKKNIRNLDCEFVSFETEGQSSDLSPHYGIL